MKTKKYICFAIDCYMVVNMAIDPVCKMEVDEASAKWKTEYKGKTYYFCAPGCKTAFEADPEKYLSGGGEPHH
jgi:YHS domain-containing protein